MLDLRPVDRSRYPSLIATLERAGYDPAREPVPVAPAAHYAIGGIVTDLDGRTTLPGLYAAGECACTGVHGANRLASNSLLECLVFGRRAARAALTEPAPHHTLPPPEPSPREPHPSAHVKQSLWREAGLTRTAGELQELLRSESLLPRLIATSALLREESRGVHFRSDFPTEDDRFAGHHIILEQGREPRLEQWS
jgi:L-aspartate oxidase